MGSKRLKIIYVEYYILFAAVVLFITRSRGTKMRGNYTTTVHAYVADNIL